MSLLIKQYELIKETREVLFNYCEVISYADFIKGNNNFGGRSIEYLLLHIINTYQFWLKEFPSQQASVYHNYESKENLQKVREFFEQTNILVAKFLAEYENKMENKISGIIKSRGINLEITPLQLFTHVATHEFHHKGQILTMSRLHGYTPVDTDVIRFE